ncbi:MAG: DUF3240 family protein [Sphingomonadaceae bacterium]
MPEILLTFHCATADRETIAGTLGSASRAPVHIRNESVRGHDYSDARTAEQVTGNLQRCALELIVEESALAEIVQAVSQAGCGMPVRWRAIPVLAHGRIA